MRGVGALCRFPTTGTEGQDSARGGPVAVAHAIGAIDVIGPIDDRAGVSAKDSARGPC